VIRRTANLLLSSGFRRPGMNDLIFRVSGTDVGSIQELKKVLSAGGSSKPARELQRTGYV